jgi:hypothetical protein
MVEGDTLKTTLFIIGSCTRIVGKDNVGGLLLSSIITSKYESHIRLNGHFTKFVDNMSMSDLDDY